MCFSQVSLHVQRFPQGLMFMLRYFTAMGECTRIDLGCVANTGDCISVQSDQRGTRSFSVDSRSTTADFSHRFWILVSICI